MELSDVLAFNNAQMRQEAARLHHMYAMHVLKVDANNKDLAHKALRRAVRFSPSIAHKHPHDFGNSEDALSSHPVVAFLDDDLGDFNQIISKARTMIVEKKTVCCLL